jgi:hypothetical protein
MNPALLIPKAGSIPGNWLLFEALGIATFAVHIVLMNIVAGVCFMALASRLRGIAIGTAGISEDAMHKVPIVLALGINFGVAPLLFLQVLYGNLHFASSILMGTWWILVIPLLMAAYYGLYAFRRAMALPGKSATALMLGASAILLFIAFVFVNNMSLMTQPEKWKAFFQHRHGTFLNLSDPALLPRLLHFLVASIAVAGLFSAALSFFSPAAEGGRDEKIRRGLHLFAYAGIVQAAGGIWFTAALPEKIITGFLGGNLVHTSVYAAGVIAGAAAIIHALRGNLRQTLIHFALTMLMMSITRANLRSAYLADRFKPGSLQSEPQYGALFLFIVVLAAVLVAVRRMLKLAYTGGGSAQ